MILYRPVGLKELALIYDSGMKAFPARLPKQPIFYPVLQLEYARQTASDWNVKNGEFAGYVTQFTVEDRYVKKLEKHKVGKTQYQELWIPEDKMEDFNKHIAGHIKVLEGHFGKGFKGFVPEEFGLQGKNAVEQFTLLTNDFLYKRMEFYREIRRSHKAVFLNYPFWQTYEFKNPGLKEKILQAIKEAWFTSFPQISLPPPVPSQEDPLARQTDSDVRRSDGPIQGEVLTKEEAEEYDYSWEDPVREETPPRKQADKKTPTKPVQYEPRSDEPDQKAVTSDEQTDPYEQTQRVASSVREKFPPLKQPYANSLVEPPHKDIPPVQQERSEIERNAPPPVVPPARQTQSHFEQGILLGFSGKFREAIDALTKAIQEDSSHVIAHTSLGIAFHRLGEDDRALASYETALKIDPIHAEAHYFRGNVLYQQGSVPEAIAAYTVGIGLQPDLIEAHQKPGPEDRLTDYTGTPAEMLWIAKPAHRILELNRFLESDPRNPALFKERAAEYYRLRNFAQAIADYSASLAIQPDDASALHARGIAYEGLGQSDRASEDYARALAIQPQLSDEYIQRGISFGEMGNFRQSITSLTDAIRLAPKNPIAYFNRGISYFQESDFEKAIPDFSAAIKLSSNNVDAYFWRGLSQEAAGHPREAIADYEQFLALSRNEDARLEIEERLRALREANEKQQNDSGVALFSMFARQRAEQKKAADSHKGIPEESQKPNRVRSERPTQSPDLYDLITALGKRAIDSTWLGSGASCEGEKAETLYALTDQNLPINGRDLIQITSGIRRTIQGDFQAFEPDLSSPWIFIRAWDGNGFYIETDDAQIEEQLKTQFPTIEEVEGAEPPYAGLFLRI